MAMKMRVLLLVSWFFLGQFAAGQDDIYQRPILTGEGGIGIGGGLEEFPPARPSAKNIRNICNGGSTKLPKGVKVSDYSNVYGPANVLVDLGRELGKCCQRPEKDKLPCSQKAWSDVLSELCDKEGSRKMVQRKCCMVNRDTRGNCFDQQSRFPNYDF